MDITGAHVKPENAPAANDDRAAYERYCAVVEPPWRDDFETWCRLNQEAPKPKPAAANVPGPTPSGRLLSRSALARLPAPTWLVQATLQDATLSEVYGRYGSLKTFLALDLALCVATGRDWHGRQTRKGKVVYVYAEGAEGLNDRVRAWEITHNNGATMPDDAIAFLPAPVDIPEGWKQLASEIRTVMPGVALVVIDPLIRCTGGKNLNAPQDMKAIVDGLEGILKAFPRVHVMVVHHPTKTGGEGGQGSNALPGSIHTLLRVDRDGDTIALSCEKQKGGAERKAEATFRLDIVSLGEDWDARTSCVLHKVDDGIVKQNAKSRQAAENETDALEALREAGRDGHSYTSWCKASELKPRTFDAVVGRLRASAKAVKVKRRWYAAEFAPAAVTADRNPTGFRHAAVNRPITAERQSAGSAGSAVTSDLRAKSSARAAAEDRLQPND